LVTLSSGICLNLLEPCIHKASLSFAYLQWTWKNDATIVTIICMYMRKLLYDPYSISPYFCKQEVLVIWTWINMPTIWLMLWRLQHVDAFHSKLCLWGLGGLQENIGYSSSVPRVFQVLARGAKNNQHVHHAGRIWQIPLLNTLHGDKRCCTIIVWAWSLKIASWERHGKPSSLCLMWGRNVGLDPWKNGYSRINPKRWQVFCL